MVQRHVPTWLAKAQTATLGGDGQASGGASRLQGQAPREADKWRRLGRQAARERPVNGDLEG